MVMHRLRTTMMIPVNRCPIATREPALPPFWRIIEVIAISVPVASTRWGFGGSHSDTLAFIPKVEGWRAVIADVDVVDIDAVLLAGTAAGVEADAEHEVIVIFVGVAGQSSPGLPCKGFN